METTLMLNGRPTASGIEITLYRSIYYKSQVQGRVYQENENGDRQK